jgi:hypothetical protein
MHTSPSSKHLGRRAVRAQQESLPQPTSPQPQLLLSLYPNVAIDVMANVSDSEGSGGPAQPATASPSGPTEGAAIKLMGYFFELS